VQTPVGDAVALEELAGICRQQGAEIASLSSVLAVDAIAASATSWLGPRADRFRHDISIAKRNLDTVANTLASLGSQFLALAREVEYQMGVMQKAQEDVLALVDSFNPNSGLPPPWQEISRELGWGPGNWPPPYDTVWLTISRALGR
jgi:hypothetical protein